jgi:hypothetical protein
VGVSPMPTIAALSRMLMIVPYFLYPDHRTVIHLLQG